MIVAGEASGDLHGSRLVTAARELDPELCFFGIGGPQMRIAGVETLVDAGEMAVVGLVEVVAHFDVIFRAFTRLRKIIRSSPPELLILIDYPDFNLRLAKEAKRAGVKVLYYISPQVWAWRPGRVKKIARLVDRMAVVFPFEVPFYEQEGVPVTFVGHPLLDTVRPTMNRGAAEEHFMLDPQRRTIGLFPGSRRGEVKRMLPTIMAAAERLKARYPELQFVMPLASSLEHADLDPYLAASSVEVKVVSGLGYDVMQVCDAIITVSGTVTLEIALMGVPMVIIYKVAPLTYQIGIRLIRVAHAGLCNIVAAERVVPELIQSDAEPEKIVAEIGRILDDQEYTATMVKKLQGVRERLGSSGCSGRVARLALEMLKQ